MHNLSSHGDRKLQWPRLISPPEAAAAGIHGKSTAAGDGLFLKSLLCGGRAEAAPAGRFRTNRCTARELCVYMCGGPGARSLGAASIEAARKYGSKLAAMAQFRKCSVRRRDAVCQSQPRPCRVRIQVRALENRALSRPRFSSRAFSARMRAA